ncbi:DUF262 domain-containing protein [Gimesia aquarii]|uniref:GmrSD restriction endonucleases N-terminal domain-containing protein n=1 Tax=Gimesia aquarii TaxID=2527964 RepID=A0A517WWJ8_9PLAN|nr:DUF262 domain-containing protein [Gimesia aquarii]QDU09641.1 hypothetical protein V202x_30170 [Gimesia aquarii]
MKDAQKPDHASLSTIISRLKEGRFVIPDFQRDFEWEPKDIRDLMRSIFLDYYIGSLLLWKGKEENFEALSCEPIYGFEGQLSREHIVLDGQQRLTAMYYAFLAPDEPLPNRANRYVYYVRVDKLMAEEHDRSFDYAWTKNHVHKILTDQTHQFAENIFPLSIVGAGGWDLPNWMQGYQKYWESQLILATDAGDQEAVETAQLRIEDAKQFGEILLGITQQYQVSYIELDKDLAVDKVCDIFTQINSKGVQLDVFDLVNALLKPKGLQLRHMFRDVKPRLEFVDTPRMNVYVLQVMSILAQGYCSPKYLYYLLPGQKKQIRGKDGTRKTEILVTNIQDFEKRWDVAVNALENTIKLLRHPQEFGGISSNYLPYVSILPAFAAIQSHVKSLPAQERLSAQRKIRHWYWASVFNNRYSGSVESTSARDFLDVKEWIKDDASEPSLILEFKSRFRNLDLRNEIRRGTSVYNGIFNLLVLQGARDWMTGNVPQHDDLDDHHIVPTSWGAKNLSGESVHTILNRTPLSAETNRHVINDQLPNEYLPQMIKSNGETTVRAILESHFISPVSQAILLRDPFTPDDFEEFIAERQKTLQEAIENLLIKERLDLPPQLRELDENVEQVELALRKAILSALDCDASKLPQHVTQKVNERIQKASKKNAAMDIKEYDTLYGKLEYFDLRELQGTITGKSTWMLFEQQFANKETLAGKFDQLAELRNGIRHSRTVDEVTRKEGEAAILWFEKVLGL